MPAAKSIPGIQRGPDFEAETHEVSRTERVVREAKLQRPAEVNDPLVTAAVDALEEAAEMADLGRQVDVQYNSETGMIVFSIYSADGDRLIRQIPPEEAIRMAENLSEQRSHLLDQMF